LVINKKKKKGKMPKIPTKRRRVSNMPNLTGKYLHQGRFLSKVSPPQNVQQNLIGRSSLFNTTEVKCKDLSLTPATVIATVATANLAHINPEAGGAGNGLATGYTTINAIQQGNAVSQRIGDKVTIKSIRVKGLINIADDADLTDNGHVRCMVVLDKQCNGAAPVYSDIIASVDYAGAYSTPFNSSIKICNKKRFVVLKDETFNLGWQSDQAIKIDWFIKNRLETEYISTAGPPTIANIATGAVYLLVFACAGEFTHLPRVVDFNIRVRYFD